MACTCAVRAHAFGIVRRASARWWLDRLPPRPARDRQAFAMGTGPHGHPRERPNPPARTSNSRPHPCRSAGCPRRAVGNGGGGKMLLSLCSHRRIVGRSQGARFHCDAATCSRFGAERHALLAGAPGRHSEPQRSADALAHCEHVLAHQPARPSSAGGTYMGCRAVPRTRHAARPLEPRA